MSNDLSIPITIDEDTQKQAFLRRRLHLHYWKDLEIIFSGIGVIFIRVFYYFSLHLDLQNVL